MFKQTPITERIAALHRLLVGHTAAEIAPACGVHFATVCQWANNAGMELLSGRYGGLRMPPPPGSSPGRGHGRRLSSMDRARIQVGLDQGLSKRRIAALIEAAPSTVSREIARASLGSRQGPVYDAQIADHCAGLRRSRPKVRKLDAIPLLRRVVVEELNLRRSPEQISGRLRRLFPQIPEVHVSHETIYQALYIQGKGALRHELTVEKALRSGRTGRIPQTRLPRRSKRPWLAGSLLTDRSAEVTDRAVPGHWEGDLVVGPENSGIVTLVERSSRFALFGKLPGKRDSLTVTQVLQQLVEGLPDGMTRTLTWDQGTEMAQHAEFTIATGMPVFFCDPHAPWQRGSNENLNGLVRDFYPKGTNFNQVSDDDLAQMQDLLNTRPRKTLGYATPAEKLDEFIQAVALTG